MDRRDTDRWDAGRGSLAGAIFDIGGTLIYPTTREADCVRHLSAWLRARGWPAGVEGAINDARQWIHESTQATGRQYTAHEALWRALARPDGAVIAPELVADAERVFFEPELAGYRVFPHAVELLDGLHAAGLRLACISNATSHWLIERIVDRFGFRPYLDPVVSSAGFGLAKPARRIFEHVLAQWNLEPGRVAMIGDTLGADIAGARGAGLRTLYVTMAPNPENRLYPHVVADAETATLAHARETLLEWARSAAPREI